MKAILRILALIALLTTLGVWVATGAHRGWNKDRVEVKTLDPVTGIEGVSYQKKFIAGVEFLAEGFTVAVVLGGASFLFRSKKTAQPINQPTTTNQN